MSTIFKVYGPFKVPKKKGIITDANLSEFWEKTHMHSKKIGCYIFAIRAAKGSVPWYVGKTERNFKAEVFSPRNIKNYNKLIGGRKGTPFIYLLTDPKKKRKVSGKHINKLETYLILQAIDRNPKLLNTKKVKIPSWGIRGIVRGKYGKISKPVKQLKQCLFSD
jgi:hypothetical protein